MKDLKANLEYYESRKNRVEGDEKTEIEGIIGDINDAIKKAQQEVDNAEGYLAQAAEAEKKAKAQKAEMDQIQKLSTEVEAMG